MKIGNRLKQIRIERQLTQETVAKDFFIRRQTISSWETGKTSPDIDSLVKLSNYYQVSLDDLLKEDANTVPKIEKQIIHKAITPIIYTLLLTDFFFLTILILKLNKIINFDMGFTVVNMFGILNAISLIEISILQLRLTREKKFKIITQKLISIGLIMIITGVLTAIIGQQNLIGGVITGIGIGLIFFKLFANKYV